MLINDSSKWALNANIKRKKSPNGINLVFISGQNVVLELNVVAGDILEIFSAGSTNFKAVCDKLLEEYEIDDQETFYKEVEQVLERFIRHDVITKLDEVAA